MTKDEYTPAEEMAGFHSKIEGEPATWSFGGNMQISGRQEKLTGERTDEIIMICYVGDTQKHVSQLMRCDFNPYTLFMTLRHFKFLKKNHPETFVVKDDIKYLINENELYRIERVKKED